MTIRMSLTGIDELIRYFDSRPERANTILSRALGEEAYVTLDKTIPVTPIEFGPLRASGHVRGPYQLPNGVMTEIAFGGPAAGYALYVHEITRYHHKGGTKAKYLEDTVNQSVRRFVANMFARARQIVEEEG